MSITIKLLDSNAKISDDINKSIAKQAAIQIQKNQKKVTDSIRALIPKWIKQQPEISSLLADGMQGSLNAQFGLVGGTSSIAVQQIIDAVVASVSVTVKPLVTLSKDPVIVFSVQPINFRDLLEIPLGKVTTLKGTILHWLEWLLLLGNSTVIYGYSYKPDRSGRSGGGTMEGGSIFRVPPQFSGTVDDNFVVRALSNRDGELQKILQRLFT